MLTVTLPKLSEAGEAESVPMVTPVPLNGIDKLGLDPLLVTVMEPVAAPVTVGINMAVRVFDAPAARVKAVETVAKENPLPEMDTPETATDNLPVLVIVTFCDAEVLTVTFPKFTEVGEAVRLLCFAFEGTISRAA